MLICALLAAAICADPCLDIMERAVGAYSDGQVAEYLAEAEREGVQEHGFPRLAANLGVLVANGRLAERKDVLSRMMTAACRDAAKGKMPPKSGGNDFSVKELAIALRELERAKAFPREVTDGWRNDLKRVAAERCYSCCPKPGDTTRSYNWAVFGAASEQARIANGLGGDAAFVERYVADQLRWFDANGMYRDPDEPAVYDFVARLQFAAILHFGYDGPSRAKLEDAMDRSAEPTLKMLSACGEIPYGGRSNQFLHNHTCYAALCEWYAVRFASGGDAAKAARFRAAARRALEALDPWLKADPLRHVKNLYPRESGIGCEFYAYFNKYMVTMGSWAMLAREFAKGRRDGLPSPIPSAPSVFATSPAFHWVFANAGEYSAQFDTAANPHYDCDGLGRLHRRGAPPQICLSTPCAKKPNYRIAGENPEELAIRPLADGRLELKRSGSTSDSAVTEWTVGGQTWRCTLTPGGMEMELKGSGEVALALPVFEFDGETHATVRRDERSVSTLYRGWRCVYATDGTIRPTALAAENRNGRYLRFEAHGRDALRVRVAIDRAERPVCNAEACPGYGDNLVVENDRFGIFLYGPREYHRWSGIDVFNKSNPRASCAGWLNDPRFNQYAIHPNFHDNRGEGMDNYAMGAARGVGGVALYGDGEWKTYVSWESCRVIHAGEDRAEVEIVYPSFSTAGKMTYRITLRRGERFFRNDVSFEKMPNTFVVGPGMDLDPKRGHGGSVVEEPGLVSLFEDPLGENGKDGSTMEAVFVAPGEAVEAMTDPQGCRVLAFRGKKNFTYWAGASWSLAGEIVTPEQWHECVRKFRKGLK